MTRWMPWIGCLLLAAPAAASERTLVLDPDRTEVSFDLPATGHDVHGLVSLDRGVLRFDAETGALDGEVVLDPAFARTGSSSRDKTLRDDVFEVARFPSIRFLPSSFDGTLAEEGRFGRKHLDSRDLGVSLWRYAPGFTADSGHRHREQEEAYVVVAGSGRILVDDEVLELSQWDVVRVAPEVVRGALIRL